MKKIIVTTTISPVTEASIKYSKMEGWDFLVVADNKTPLDTYSDIDCEVMTVESQNRDWKDLSDLIGWNCAERKTIGVIEAYKRGYDVINLTTQQKFNYVQINNIVDSLIGAVITKQTENKVIITNTISTDFEDFHKIVDKMLISIRYFFSETINYLKSESNNDDQETNESKE